LSVVSGGKRKEEIFGDQDAENRESSGSTAVSHCFFEKPGKEKRFHRRGSGKKKRQGN